MSGATFSKSVQNWWRETELRRVLTGLSLQPFVRGFSLGGAAMTLGLLLFLIVALLNRSKAVDDGAPPDTGIVNVIFHCVYTTVFIAGFTRILQRLMKEYGAPDDPSAVWGLFLYFVVAIAATAIAAMRGEGSLGGTTLMVLSLGGALVYFGWAIVEKRRRGQQAANS